MEPQLPGEAKGLIDEQAFISNMGVPAAWDSLKMWPCCSLFRTLAATHHLFRTLDLHIFHEPSTSDQHTGIVVAPGGALGMIWMVACAMSNHGLLQSPGTFSLHSAPLEGGHHSVLDAVSEDVGAGACSPKHQILWA